MFTLKLETKWPYCIEMPPRDADGNTNYAHCDQTAPVRLFAFACLSETNENVFIANFKIAISDFG